MYHETHVAAALSARATYRTLRLHVRGREQLARVVRDNIAKLERIVKDLNSLEAALTR